MRIGEQQRWQQVMSGLMAELEHSTIQTIAPEPLTRPPLRDGAGHVFGADLTCNHGCGSTFDEHRENPQPCTSDGVVHFRFEVVLKHHANGKLVNWIARNYAMSRRSVLEIIAAVEGV